MADNTLTKEVLKRLAARWKAQKGEKLKLSPPGSFFESGHPDKTKRPFQFEKAFFESTESPLADSIGRKPSKSLSGFLYRKARLVNKSEPWYIIYYTTDALNETLIRKRVLTEELKAIKNKTERLKFANEAIADINHMLHNDWHAESIQPPPSVLKFDFRHFTVIKAIDYVAEIKRDVEQVRDKTFKEYMATKTTMKEFFLSENINQDYLIRNINEPFIRKYFDYLKQVRKSANKTYNARRAILHAVFAELIRRDGKLFHGINPIAGVKFLKTESKKHAAYSDEQITRLREAILKKKEDHLLLFIQFMYYSLARPEEIRNVKIGDIKLSDRKILFQSHIAKTSIEQYVGINETFANIIEESGILRYPENYYAFSVVNGNVSPGQKRVSVNYFYKHVKPYIVALGFTKLNSNYTMYSFKHTGAIALYKATKDIKLVQSQCRHQNIEQTNIYLRDLGVMDDFEQLNKWKGPL